MHSNLTDQQLNPGNHKPKIFNKYTKERKESKYDTTGSHQLTRKENKRRNKQKRTTKTTPN